MMIQHIALTVNNFNEINNFFEEVLHLKLHHIFSINEETTQQIFHVNEKVDVYVLEHQDVQFELFVSNENETQVFSHVCLVYQNAKNIYQKASDAGYRSVIRHGKVNDTYYF
jgi:catechol 2,3-dioxygenase-like lactoylglutathione lyase family enzyme